MTFLGLGDFAFNSGLLLLFCSFVWFSIIVSYMGHLMPPEDSDLKSPAEIWFSIIQAFHNR